MSDTVAEEVEIESQTEMDDSNDIAHEETANRDTSMDPFNFRDPLLYSAPGTAGSNYIKEMVLGLLEPLQNELIETKDMLSEVVRDNSILKDRLIRLEGFSRRYNLKFNGIREMKNESKQDCKRTIRNILM